MFRLFVQMKGDTGEVTIGNVAKLEEKGQYDDTRIIAYDDEGNVVASYHLNAIAGYRREPVDE